PPPASGLRARRPPRACRRPAPGAVALRAHRGHRSRVRRRRRARPRPALTAATWRSPMFRAMYLERRDDEVVASIRDLSDDDLPAGEVLIDVEWSTVNYKDGLAY